MIWCFPRLRSRSGRRFYAESRLTAALFGIPQSLTPEHWFDFVAYKEAMATSDVLIVSEAARAIAMQIVAPQGAGLGWPRWYRDLTAHLLPPQGFASPSGLIMAKTSADEPIALLPGYNASIPCCRNSYGLSDPITKLSDASLAERYPIARLSGLT